MKAISANVVNEVERRMEVLGNEIEDRTKRVERMKRDLDRETRMLDMAIGVFQELSEFVKTARKPTTSPQTAPKATKAKTTAKKASEK